MDEAVGEASVGPAAQEAVPMGEPCGPMPQRGLEVVGGVVVVVEVEFDLAVALSTQARECADVLLPVLIDGVEERVPRAATVAVAKAGEPDRVVVDPLLDGLVPLGPRGGLEVVGDAEQHVGRGAACRTRQAPALLLEEGPDP